MHFQYEINDIFYDDSGQGCQFELYMKLAEVDTHTENTFSRIEWNRKHIVEKNFESSQVFYVKDKKNIRLRLSFEFEYKCAHMWRATFYDIASFIEQYRNNRSHKLMCKRWSACVCTKIKNSIDKINWLLLCTGFYERKGKLFVFVFFEMIKTSTKQKQIIFSMQIQSKKEIKA